MKLIKVAVLKYKSILNEREVDIEKGITTLVGQNESGKTCFLEAINLLSKQYLKEEDYPRSEIADKELDKEKQKKDLSKEKAVVYTMQISDELKQKIEKDLGFPALKSDTFEVILKYDGKFLFLKSPLTDAEHFIRVCIEKMSLKKELFLGKTMDDFLIFLERDGHPPGYHVYGEVPISIRNIIIKLKKMNKFVMERSTDWPQEGGCWFSTYIVEKWIMPRLPKVFYFDTYPELPSEINLDSFDDSDQDKGGDKDEKKIVKALLSIADSSIAYLKKEEPENSKFLKEVPEMSTRVTGAIGKYWKTDEEIKEEKIKIRLNFLYGKLGGGPVRKKLTVRVANKDGDDHDFLLRERSGGFRWFFSFLVRFSAMQKENNAGSILLLDEPGLHLHATAQKELMKLLRKLSKHHQIIYTTHSPFMVDFEHSAEIRTVFFDKEKGSIISSNLGKKNSDTLFPLQAALGYDLAQSLFVAKNNLLVEGITDVFYLKKMSYILKKRKDRPC